MQANIIPIGTSKGIRIPKYLLEKYNFTNTVEIDDTGDGILIKSSKNPRANWDKEFQQFKEENKFIDMPTSKWDQEEWEW